MGLEGLFRQAVLAQCGGEVLAGIRVLFLDAVVLLVNGSIGNFLAVLLFKRLFNDHVPQGGFTTGAGSLHLVVKFVLSDLGAFHVGDSFTAT